MTEQFANNASSTLNGAINNSQTSIVVTNATSFPTLGNFRLLLGVNPLTAEIVLVTAVSGTTFTVVRGQESTAASSWADLTTVTHIVTAGAVEALRANLRRTKPLDLSLDSVGISQDGYALTWLNSDGYWAARPGSPFTISGNELNTTRTLSIDGYGTYASAHGDGYKLYINGPALSTKFAVGEIPLTTRGFGYVSNATQSFTVPAGIISLKVKMWGPGAGTGNYSSAGGGGPGGYSTGYLSVTPGEVILLAVGSGGKHSVSPSGNGGDGGWPGGGFGTRGDASGGGGGGLTGIFTGSMTQANALMIAGGGGGATGYGGGSGGGGGGGLVGGNGSGTQFGRGGTQSAGGLNGNNTSSPAYTVGSALAGGTAFTDQTTSTADDCGGGGSGYWGGGAGQGDGHSAGGGSGFLHATRITSGITTTGSSGSAGSATTLPPNSSDSNYIAGVGIGGAATGVGGTDGGDGYVVLQWGGISSFDNDSLDFGNGTSISTLESDITIFSPAKINLQSTTNLSLSSSTTSTLSGTTDVRFNTNSLLRGYFDNNGIFRFGPNASSTVSALNDTFPLSSSDIGFGYSTSSCWFNIFSSASNARSAVSAYNSSGGGTGTTGISIQAPGFSHGIPGYASHGVIEHTGSSSTALTFASVNGDGTGNQIKGRIWRLGAWVVGDATHNDTVTEAQANLTGPLINISPATGTATSTTNQALLYNIAGVATLQGESGHNFITGTTSIASTNANKFITSLGRRKGITNVGTNVTVPDGYNNIFVPALTAGITITLPSTPTTGDTYLVKDRDGSATAFNIIIAGNGKNIEQFTGTPASSLTLNQNYDSVTLIYNGTFWSII